MNAVPHPKRTVVVRAVAVLVVAALVVAGVWWWRSRESADAGVLRATGSVEAQEYQVSPAIAGAVSKVLVDEGTAVKAGQELVTLDARPLALQVDQARQGVAAAQAALTKAREDLDDDNGSQADVAAARARLAQARAAVSLAQIQQGYAKVTAPAAGVVVTVTTNAGENAAPARTLLTLIDPDDLWVRVYVPEPRLGDAAVGHRARIRSDSGEQAAGTVSWVATQAEFTPNTVQTEEQRTKLVYEVRVRLDDPSAGALKPGMPVDVEFAS